MKRNHWMQLSALLSMMTLMGMTMGVFAVNDIGDPNVAVVDVINETNRMIDVDPGDQFWLTVPAGSGVPAVRVQTDGVHGQAWLKAGEFLPVRYDEPGEYTIRLKGAHGQKIVPFTVRVFAPPTDAGQAVAGTKGDGTLVATASPSFSLGSVYAGLYANNATNKFPLRIVSRGSGDCMVSKYGGGWSRTYSFAAAGEQSDVVDVPAGQIWTLVKGTGGTHTLSTNSPSRLKVVDLVLADGPAYAPVGQPVANTNLFLFPDDVAVLRAMPGPAWVTNNPIASSSLFEWTTNSVDYVPFTGLGNSVAATSSSNVVQVACHSPNTTPVSQKTIIRAVGVEFESRDRFVHGTVRIPDEMADVELRIRNRTTGQDLGTYSNIMGSSPAFHRYEQESDIFSDAEMESEAGGNLPPAVMGQPVVFVRDADDATKLNFYTVFDGLGEVEVTLVYGGQEHLFTHTLESDTDFSGLIDFLDARIESLEIPYAEAGIGTSVVTPIETQDGDGEVEHRNLVTKILIGIAKLPNAPISLVKGIVDGLWDGITSDIEGVQGAADFLLSPIKRSSEIYHAFQVLGVSGIMDEIGTMIDNGLVSFMSEAEQSVTWTFDQTDLTDALATRAYVMGYTMGFLTEQIILLKGVSVGLKAAKGVLLSTKIGQVTVQGVMAVNRFRVTVLHFAGRFAKTPEMMRQIERMAKQLADLPIGNKTAGEIIASRVQKIDVMTEEIGRYVNGQWDNIGHRAQARLAHVMEVVLGEDLTEKAMRGFLRTYERLIVANADRYDDLLKLMRKADGSTDKAALKQTLEASKDTFDNTPAGQRPRVYVKGIENTHPTTYRYVVDISNIQNGKLPQHTGDGWYCSFDKFDEQLLARSELQLPQQNTARYRIEIRTSDVSDDLRIPYGKAETEEFLEPVSRDFPELGIGGGTQVKIRGPSDGITVHRIWDMQTGQYIEVP